MPGPSWSNSTCPFGARVGSIRRSWGITHRPAGQSGSRLQQKPDHVPSGLSAWSSPDGRHSLGQKWRAIRANLKCLSEATDAEQPCAVRERPVFSKRRALFVVAVLLKSSVSGFSFKNAIIPKRLILYGDRFGFCKKILKRCRIGCIKSLKMCITILKKITNS